MAELKRLERTIGKPAAPDISGAAQAHTVFGKAVQSVATSIGEYDEASRALESSTLFAETSNNLNKSLIDALHPTNLGNMENGNALERYMQDSQAAMQSALNLAPRGFKDELKLKLNDLINNNGLRIQSALQADIIQKTKSNIEAMVDTSLLEMSDAVRTGDNFNAQKSRNEILDLLEKGHSANLFSAKEVQLAKLKVNNTYIQSEYTALGEKAALSSRREVSALKENLAHNTAGLPPHELDVAKKAASAEAQETENLLAGAKAEKVDELETLLAQKETEHEEYRVRGNQAKADKVEAEMQKIVQQLEHLNSLSRKEAFNKKLGIQKSGIELRYFERGRQDANAAAGVVEKALSDFGEGKFDEPLSAHDEILAAQAYVKGVQQVQALKSQQSAVDYAEVVKGIEDGSITTPADIAGKGLNALNGAKAETYLRKRNAKENKKVTDLNSALTAISAGGGAQDSLTGPQKDAAFRAMASKLQEEREQQTRNPDYKLDYDDVTQVIKQMNTDVPWLNNKLNYSLQNADPKTEADIIAAALTMGRQLSDHPNTLRGIDPKSRSIMNMANAALISAKNPNVSNIIEKARAAANPDDPVKEAYAKRWQSLSEKDKQKLYKSIFTDNPNNNIETYGQFKNLLELYNNSSDTIDAALESVRQEMEPVYGKDRFFEPDKTGYLPSNTAVPFSEIGQWYPNQVFLNLYGLTKRHQEDPNLNPLDKLEWIYNDVPEKIPEDKLMHDNLHLLSEQASQVASLTANPTLKAKWRGQVVDVFYKADGMSRVGDNDRVKYVFYFKDQDGQTHYITDPKSKDGSGYWVEYPLSLPQFLPGIFNEQDNENYDDVILKAYRGERVNTPGTRKGSLKELKAQEQKRKSELRTDLEKDRAIVPSLKEKRQTPKLANKLLEESNERL